MFLSRTDTESHPPVGRNMTATIDGLAEVVGASRSGLTGPIAVTGWREAGRPSVFTMLIDALGTESTWTDRLRGWWRRRRSHEIRPVHPHPFAPGRLRICRFDAFLHEGTQEAERGLAAAIAVELARARRWPRRLLRPIPVTMAAPRVQFWRQVMAAGLSTVAAIVAVALPPTQELLLTLAQKSVPVLTPTSGQSGAVVVLAALFWLVAGRAWAATTAVARFVSRPDERSAGGSIADVRSYLGMLAKQSLRRDGKLIVVVENLDSCAGDYALSVCETAVKLSGHPGVVIVFVGELDAIEEAAQAKWADATSDQGGVNRGVQHVKDLIPLVVPLPRPSSTDVTAALRGRRDDVAVPDEGE